MLRKNVAKNLDGVLPEINMHRPCDICKEACKHWGIFLYSGLLVVDAYNAISIGYRQYKAYKRGDVGV